MGFHKCTLKSKVYQKISFDSNLKNYEHESSTVEVIKVLVDKIGACEIFAHNAAEGPSKIQ